MKYVSLHNHSHFSLLDGYQTIPEMVSRAKELGATALSITDHGTMRGVVEFYKECKAQGIKPIIGCEFYFYPDITVRDRSMTHHLVLLAMNEEGYRNLKELDTIAYAEDHMFYKPRIDESDLRKHSDGIVCLSACMASIVNTPDGEEWFEKFYNIFGDRFFAEIQPLNIDKQQECGSTMFPSWLRPIPTMLVPKTNPIITCGCRFTATDTTTTRTTNGARTSCGKRRGFPMRSRTNASRTRRESLTCAMLKSSSAGSTILSTPTAMLAKLSAKSAGRTGKPKSRTGITPNTQNASRQR